MNLLFVNYSDFASNSIHHIAGFANQLQRMGHDCLVALTALGSPPDLRVDPLFKYGSYEAILNENLRFENSKSADIVHAWTPRENVRAFTSSYQSRFPSKLVIHLEDNEEALIESFYQSSIESLRSSEIPAGFFTWEPQLSHPIKYREFLLNSDGITVIIDTLKRFAPSKTPILELWPGIEESLPSSPNRSRQLRSELGIGPDEKLIVYTGGVSSSNFDDIFHLYEAVAELNERGHPTRLLKTGPSAEAFLSAVSDKISRYVIDLGVLPVRELPYYINLADALVQPGRPDAFNRFRLPSKLPEFLASGKPVISTDANIASRATKEETFLPLISGSPREIADQCIRLFNSEELARNLARNGKQFALQHFSLAENTARLAEFYEEIISFDGVPRKCS